MFFWLAVSILFAVMLAECAAELGSEQGHRSP
jgi:hypothetical protein